MKYKMRVYIYETNEYVEITVKAENKQEAYNYIKKIFKDDFRNLFISAEWERITV